MNKQANVVTPKVGNLEGLLAIFGALQPKVAATDPDGNTYPYTVQCYTDNNECKFTYYDRDGLEIPKRYQEIEDGILDHIRYIKEMPTAFGAYGRYLVYYYLVRVNSNDLSLAFLIVNDEYVDMIMSMPFNEADSEYLELRSRSLS
jgi:hypothetical protein